jgi:hypothetical protein
MNHRCCLLLPLAVAALVALNLDSHTSACCPVPPLGRPVVNGDQTVVILWDPATKTEHFIRRASFKSDADDFGFLIPTPAQPELNESGDAAFPYLEKLTEPEIQKVARPKSGTGCACSDKPLDYTRVGSKMAANTVVVLQEKSVAGFKAMVLEASSAKALTGWLKENGYAFSPEVEAWAKPYVDGGWKITALKVEKSKGSTENKNVAAGALRMSFKTDRPLFPYREPDPKNMASTLGASHRLLRIYFLGDARYRGDLTAEIGWNAKVAWSNKLGAEARKKTLDLLKLPETTGPNDFWLTEFEDNWPYKVAPADLYFSASDDQTTVKRPPIIQYVSSPLPTDLMFCALSVAVIAPPLVRRLRLKPGRSPN